MPIIVIIPQIMNVPKKAIASILAVLRIGIDGIDVGIDLGIGGMANGIGALPKFCVRYILRRRLAAPMPMWL